MTISINIEEQRSAGQENVLSESGNVKWKVKKNSLKFLFDTTVYVPISNATLTCYAQKDSTELYNATGNYYPELQQFRGTKGVVTWEKAGFSGKEVFAELSDYSINMLKSSFTVDSARLTHTTYFKEPVAGLLSDQAISFTDKNKADFPRFETYVKEFKIKDIYKGVNYEGGLKFEGALLRERGKMQSRLKSLFSEMTLFISGSVQKSFSSPKAV